MIAQPSTASEQVRQLEADAAAWQRARDAGGEVVLLDKDQLAELAGWLPDEVQRGAPLSASADAFVAASRAAARRGWWPGRGAIGPALAILLILMILATPITLLTIVGLTAAMIHKFL